MSSIKYAGPKAWAKVPKRYKEIAFRKPFSKKFKQHILDEIHEDLPPQTLHKNRNYHSNEIVTLFESDDEDEVFLGFESITFDHTQVRDEMITLFESDDEDTEFFGFDSCDTSIKHMHKDNCDVELKALFESDIEEEYNFLGF